ncbi:MAG TPA: NUDIX hydrolase [Bacteroidota bacterium]|nr:NUDIX hydrolase [Bacteroidota bacterium]
MPLRRWKTLSSITVAANRWWVYRKDEYELPSGKKGEYHLVHTNGASLVVPVGSSGELHLVNQYRYLCARESVEFPCGGVKDGATYEETALGELREETGFACGTLEQAGSFNPYNGVTDEICRVYIARDLKFVGGAPDDTEEFEPVTLRPAEVDARIASGEIWDGMTIAAWAIVRPLIARGSPP